MPHTAFGAELSTDPHERTWIFTIRQLSWQLGGVALDLIGYEPNIEQSEATKQGLRLIFSGLPVICYSIAIFVLARYLRISSEELARIRTELDARALARSESP